MNHDLWSTRFFYTAQTGFVKLSKTRSDGKFFKFVSLTFFLSSWGEGGGGNISRLSGKNR
jgi:hypothetical protein